MQQPIMTVESAQPQNELERVLLRAKERTIPLDSFLSLLLASDLFIPSRSEVQADSSGFVPLIFDRHGIPMTAVFTVAARVLIYQHEAKYFLKMNGRELLARMPPDYGIVVNPGHQLGLEILPHGVKQIVRDLG